MVIDVLKVIALVHNSNVMVHLNVQISQMKTIVNINMTTALVVLNVLKDIAYLQIGSVMVQPTVQMSLMRKIVKMKKVVDSSVLKVIAYLHN